MHWMELEEMILSKVRRQMTDTGLSPLYVIYKVKKTRECKILWDGCDSTVGGMVALHNQPRFNLRHPIGSPKPIWRDFFAQSQA